MWNKDCVWQYLQILPFILKKKKKYVALVNHARDILKKVPTLISPFL